MPAIAASINTNADGSGTAAGLPAKLALGTNTALEPTPRKAIWQIKVPVPAYRPMASPATRF